MALTEKAKIQTLAVGITLPPEEDSFFITEISRFVEVMPTKPSVAVADYINSKLTFVAEFENKYKVKAAIQDVDDDGSIEIDIYDLDLLMYNFEEVIDTFADGLFEQIESWGFEIIAHGVLSQEIKVALDEGPSSNLN